MVSLLLDVFHCTEPLRACVHQLHLFQFQVTHSGFKFPYLCISFIFQNLNVGINTKDRARNKKIKYKAAIRSGKTKGVFYLSFNHRYQFPGSLATALHYSYSIHSFIKKKKKTYWAPNCARLHFTRWGWCAGKALGEHLLRFYSHGRSPTRLPLPWPCIAVSNVLVLMRLFHSHERRQTTTNIE